MSASPAGIRVLLADDDDVFRKVLSAELARRGWSVATAATGQAVLDGAAQAETDVILLDLRLPDLDGIEVLRKLRERDAGAGVVVLTGHGTIDTAIQAVRLGAHNYLEKPCPIEAIEVALQKAHEHRRLVERQLVLEDGFASRDAGAELVGASPAFEKVRQTVARVAPSDSTVLILGETGVGKERIARLLHASSRRRERPFVVVDCTTLHEELLQSELFGHEKGAFTGAIRQKHGLFEVATGGTLFLDEVGDMGPEIQAKLLRVLETGRFRRLGGTREIAVDVRVLAATHRNLREGVARGRFREDLFFRLSTFTVAIPPLRERPQDIAALADHLVGRLNARLALARQLHPEALAALLRHPWPGNVRELAHVLEQTLVLADDDEIRVEDLPESVRPSAPGIALPVDPDLMLPLREVQRRHVLAVMERVGGNRARAARILEVSERNLYRLLKRWGSGGDSDSADPTEDDPDSPSAL